MIEPKPGLLACICHETVVGKSVCPVHGPHPGLLADLTKRVERIERQLGMKQGRVPFKEIADEIRADLASPPYAEAQDVLAAIIRESAPTPGARVYHREVAKADPTGMWIDGPAGARVFQRFAPTPVEPAPHPAAEVETAEAFAARFWPNQAINRQVLCANLGIRDAAIRADERRKHPFPMSGVSDKEHAAVLAKLEAAERDRLAGLKVAHDVTLETQTVEEACTELVRLVRQARDERDSAIRELEKARATMEAADVALGAEGTVLARIAEATRILRAFDEKP